MQRRINILPHRLSHLILHHQASDPRGKGYVLTLNRPVPLVSGQTYSMRLDTTGVVTLVGAAPINESDWDDGLPLRYGNYDGFGGLYQGDSICKFIGMITPIS